MSHDHEMLELAHTFLTGLRTGNAELLRSILLEDATWSLPGSSAISGDAVGMDAILDRVKAISAVGMHLALKHLLVGRHGVALSLHNTATQPHAAFDQHLVTVLSLNSGKVWSIETFMHNVDNLNQFFVK